MSIKKYVYDFSGEYWEFTEDELEDYFDEWLNLELGTDFSEWLDENYSASQVINKKVDDFIDEYYDTLKQEFIDMCMVEEREG